MPDRYLGRSVFIHSPIFWSTRLLTNAPNGLRSAYEAHRFSPPSMSSCQMFMTISSTAQTWPHSLSFLMMRLRFSSMASSTSPGVTPYTARNSRSLSET